MKGESQTREEESSGILTVHSFLKHSSATDRNTRGTRICFGALESHGQLVGDGHEHLEDRHEGRDLAEVAAAHHLRVNLQTLMIVTDADAAADLVQAAEDAGRQRLVSQLVVQTLQTLGGIVQFALCLRVSGGQLTALHKAAEGGLEDHMFGGDFLLPHTLGRKLL